MSPHFHTPIPLILNTPKKSPLDISGFIPYIHGFAGWSLRQEPDVKKEETSLLPWSHLWVPRRRRLNGFEGIWLDVDTDVLGDTMDTLW